MTANDLSRGVVYKGCGKGRADFYLYSNLCKGCGLCITKCPINVKGDKCLQWSNVTGVFLTPAVKPDPEKCIACGTCEMVCPDSAIRIEKTK